MFSTDRPINNSDDDNLDRNAFASRLASALTGIGTGESLVVGLVGPWGSGKTSVINLVCNSIERDSTMTELNAGDTIIVRFNPWNTIEPENIVESFFSTIYDRISRAENLPVSSDRAKKMLLETFECYIDALKPGRRKAVLRAITHRKKRKTKQNSNSISYSKERVTAALEKFELKILVVIDDIDRLRKEQICSIFQLVSAIADFSSLNYLLAYDEAIVENALCDMQGTKGSGYLEKIIQVPLVIPEISELAIANLLSKDLSIITKYTTDTERIEDVSLRIPALSELIKKRVHSIRDLKRYTNILRFDLNSYGNGFDAVDIAAMTFLKVFYSKCFQWVVLNKRKLCIQGDVGEPVPSFPDKILDDLGLEIRVEIELSETDVDIVSSLVKSVFAHPRGVRSSENETRAMLQTRKRIVDIDLFNAYLIGGSANLDSSLAAIQRLIRLDDEEQLSKALSESANAGRYGEILEGFLGLKNTISSDRAPSIIQAFAENIPYAEYSDPYYSENSRTIDLIDYLASLIGIEVTSSYLINLFSKLKYKEIVYLAEFIVRQDRVFLRNKFSGGGQYKKLVDETTLKSLEDAYVDAIEKSALSTELQNWDDLYIPLLLWKNINSDSFSNTLASLRNNPLSIVLYANVFTHRWNSFNSSNEETSYGWGVSEEVKRYADPSMLLELIDQAILTKEFWDLPKKTLYRTAALISGIESGKYGELDRFNVDEARSKLEEWRRKQNGHSPLRSL